MSHSKTVMAMLVICWMCSILTAMWYHRIIILMSLWHNFWTDVFANNLLIFIVIVIILLSCWRAHLLIFANLPQGQINYAVLRFWMWLGVVEGQQRTLLTFTLNSKMCFLFSSNDTDILNMVNSICNNVKLWSCHV